MSNPYRIPRPRYGVVLEGKYHPPTAFADPYRLVLTHEDLWLSENLSIPLGAIQNVEVIGDRVVRVSYFNALNSANEVADITSQNVLGGTDKEAVWNLANTLTVERSKAQSVEDFLAELAQGGGGRVARCEACGDSPGALVDLGYVVCLGLTYRSAPMRRYLCRKHAIRRCLACNLYTGICGWWGIPGIVTAPARLWQNTSSVRRACRVGPISSLCLFCAGGVFWLLLFALFTLLVTTDIVPYLEKQFR